MVWQPTKEKCPGCPGIRSDDEEDDEEREFEVLSEGGGEDCEEEGSVNVAKEQIGGLLGSPPLWSF